MNTPPPQKAPSPQSQILIGPLLYGNHSQNRIAALELMLMQTCEGMLDVEENLLLLHHTIVNQAVKKPVIMVI